MDEAGLKSLAETDAIKTLPPEVVERLIRAESGELRAFVQKYREEHPGEESNPFFAHQLAAYTALFNDLNTAAEKAPITMSDIPQQLGAASPISSKERSHRRAKSKNSRKSRRINRARG